MGTCAAEIQCEAIVTLDPEVLGAKAGPLTAAEHWADDNPKSGVSDITAESQAAAQKDQPCNEGRKTLKTYKIKQLLL